MEEKKPIDRIRESSGHMVIGTIEDGAIVEMNNFGGRLLIIKERSIYEMLFADSIDPKRTNINLPPTIHKLIIDKGTESETVSRTFMTAKTLFRPDYIIKTVDCDKVISLTIDMLSEISLLEKEIREYQVSEDKVSIEYEERRIQKNPFELPSIVNLESLCKTIFQKVDHVEQILMEIITQFYPNQGLTKQSHFPKFHDILKLKYGEKDSFAEFVNKTLYFMRVVREMRNGLDHRLAIVFVKDFEIKPDGNILAPTIELTHKEVKLVRTSLREFLKLITVNLLEIIETTFAFLASRNVKPDGMTYLLKEIPEEKRRYKYMKYSFWMPVGPEGFYCQ